MTGIITSEEQLEKIISKMLPKALVKAMKANPEKLFTPSQVSRKIGKKYDTVRRMMKEGRIVTTADGKYISQQAIDNYLNGK